MYEYHEAHAITLVSRLNDLRALFDQQMVNGVCFEEVKKIYKEIKQLESELRIRHLQSNS